MDQEAGASPTGVEQRLSELEGRLAAAEDYLQAAGHVSTWAAEQLAAVGPRLDALEELLRTAVGLGAWNHNELQRLGPQLAALEQRVDRSVRSDPGAARRGGDALREAQDEHERVRARMALLSSYEERISRLERV